MIFIGCFKITLDPVLMLSQRDFISAEWRVREGRRKGDERHRRRERVAPALPWDRL